MEGRTKFLNVMKGRNKERPPFIPFIHSLAARTGNVALEQMAMDPGYYTSALEGIRELLGLDVIVANYDTTLEFEALGARINWQGDHHLPSLEPPCHLSPIAPDEYLLQGRIPVVLETVNRLVQTASKKTAVAVALMGPCTFFNALAGQPEEARVKKPAEIIKEYGGLLTRLVKGVCDFGIDAVFFREDPLGERFPELLFGELADCKSSYATLFNIIKAYNAQHIIITDKINPDGIRIIHNLLKPNGMVFLGNRFAIVDLYKLHDLTRSLRIAIGLPIPIGLTDQEDLSAQIELYDTFIQEKSPQNVFFTSDGEISCDIDMEMLLSLTVKLQ